MYVFGSLVVQFYQFHFSWCWDNPFSHESKFETTIKALVFAVHPIIFSYVLNKSPGRQFPLFFGQPRCCPGEIWEYEVGNEGNHDLISVRALYLSSVERATPILSLR
jgi:hypothetical protein